MRQKRPRVIAMLGQKGGSHKTSIALHLAVCAQGDGERVGIIDTDPQGSAHSWSGFRDKDAQPAVALCRSDQVDEYFAAAAKTQLSLLVIDTPPHATTQLYDAIKFADLLVMPCRPSILDLSAVAATVRIAEASKKAGTFVLTGVPPRSVEVAATRKALASYPFPVAPQSIGHRQAYVRALGSGLTVSEFEPAGLAAEEMRQLWKWIDKQL
jgi:chromosome partitioning protein